MTSNFEKFQRLLEELFQLDQADLDFGIYRIMNQKRDEVVRFLEKDLLPQVKEALGEYKSADKAELQKELDKAIEKANELGVDPETTTKFKELQRQIADSSVDVTALENEVFSHLYNFFRRYYHEGDFISLRRYKEGVYAIPYEGEEVKLHWANHDQYYVKSSEYFRDYIFTMPSGKRVRVHLVAASSEQDNKKETPGKERRFILCEDDPIYKENDELFIRFEYRPEDGKKKQDALNQEAIERVFGAEGFDEWIGELSKPAPTKVNPNRTVLEKHLAQYTARNTFDYFIHKDLGGFLRRELDFYIKNEVMHLDDIEHDTVPRVEQYLSKIKVIRRIAHKVIQFLQQLENFQKKLWLKKKFVVETSYCVTLDRVPKELYLEIAANDAQREEWVRLFAIDRIEKDLTSPGYSEPLTEEFLQANQTLLVDTRLFSSQFTDKVLAQIDISDENGLLIHGDNVQALNLLNRRFSRSIDCVFIDPPYNTGSDEFLYKDDYRHASWLSLLSSCVSLTIPLLSSAGAIWCSLDSEESPRFWLMCNELFGEQNFAGHVVWQHSVQTKGYAGSLAVGHNNLFCFGGGSDFRLGVLERTDEHNKAYSNPDNDPRGPWRTGYLVNSLFRPNLKYEVETPSGNSIAPPDNGWRYSKETMKAKISTGEIFFSEDETRLVRKIYLSDQEGHVPNSVWLGKDSGTSRSANLALKAMLPSCDFTTAKPVELIERVLRITSQETSTVMDYFAGSGTTAHATIRLNDQTGGCRKYILAETGKHFDDVLVPRIKKAIYADEWKSGVPGHPSRRSHLLKLLKIESYEDSLGNLALQRTSKQATLLEEDKELCEQYVLSYMLDVESRESLSLLNVGSFCNPSQYKLRVERNGETQLVNVDLVETFNWLLGLTVKHIDMIRGVRVVVGTNPGGGQVLVLWRNLDEADNDALDEWFRKQDYNTKDQEYDLIYVNGDNNLENFRRADQTWKVRLIEEEFKVTMFSS